MTPQVSILIPTQGRIHELRELLSSLAQMESRDRIAHEIIVANNAPDELVAEAVERLVDEQRAREPERWRHVRERLPGKSRALNKIIPLAKGQILGFVDDDVTVERSWLRVTAEFFARHPYELKQGSILIPPELSSDVKLHTLLNRYRTICYYQKPGPQVREIRSLNGANMALRREFLQNCGLFDERIGPGQSGTSMDVEFGERVMRLGGRIGYEPRSIVYHQVDWSRLSESYFRQRHEMQGHSRLIYKQSSALSIAANLMRAILEFGVYTVAHNERKKYRAKGRIYHYRAMAHDKIRGSS
ncbi:MAG TPA: glycosyltransferase family 2 protein [Candidatus Binatia bacterium]|nr:glycosyltransferase family 2 protein [Candidatus Binatia bacterium]